jgi:hypothetical protein
MLILTAPDIEEAKRRCRRHAGATRRNAAQHD